MKSEKEKYFDYIRSKINNGLKFYDLYVMSSNINAVTEEEFYSELNRMINAPDLEDREVLERFFPK